MYLTFDDEGNTDFEQPINLTPEQMQNVVAAFKKVMGEDALVIDVVEPKVAMTTSSIKNNWTSEARAKLFSAKSNEKLSAELGIDKDTVGMMRVSMTRKFYAWRKSKNKTGETDALIKEFIDDMGWTA